MSFDIRFDTRAFEKAMKRAPKIMAFAARDGMERGMAGFRKEWKATLPAGMKRAQAFLFKSFAKGDKLDNLEARMFPLKYRKSLLLSEKGGTVRPKRAKSLVIPLPAFRTKGGRGKPKRAFRSAREFVKARKNTKLVKLGRALVAFRKRGKKGKFKAIGAVFAIVPSIRVKPWLGYLKAWQSTKPRFIERINKTIRDKGLKKVFGPGAVK